MAPPKLAGEVILRLQVEDNPEPIKELKRLVDKWSQRIPPSASPECK